MFMLDFYYTNKKKWTVSVQTLLQYLIEFFVCKSAVLTSKLVAKIVHV